MTAVRAAGVKAGDRSYSRNAQYSELSRSLLFFLQVSFAELLSAYREQKATLALLYWGTDYADPDTNVTPFTNYDAKVIAWRNSWNDPDIGAKAHDAALMTDQAQREAAYKEITEYVLHNCPYAVLYQPAALFGVRNTVQGFAWNPMGFADFWKIIKIG